VWAAWIDTWSEVYANHALLQTGVSFVHIGGLAVGGGCAIAADLATVAAARDAWSRAGDARVLKGVHTIVLWGLTALFISGVLLLAADTETYWYSRLFWIKMMLVALLLGNGLAIVRTERRAISGEARAAARLRGLAMLSLLLWSLTTLAGTALPNFG
jgi:hypothetical protein